MIAFGVMDYLVYGRASAGAGDEDTPQLDDAHWTYMDAHAGRMTARGPTLTPDRETWTGSLHVVDLPDATAAHAFAEDDPYHRAGLFRDHLVQRFDTLLGHTMWDVLRNDGDVPFLLLADDGPGLPAGSIPPARPPASVAGRLVLWGVLHPADAQDLSGPSTGTAVALLAPDEAAARALVAAEPALLVGSATWQLHAWEFGGRR